MDLEKEISILKERLQNMEQEKDKFWNLYIDEKLKVAKLEQSQTQKSLSAEEILQKNNCYPTTMKETQILDGEDGTMYDRVLKSMEEYASQKREKEDVEKLAEEKYKRYIVNVGIVINNPAHKEAIIYAMKEMYNAGTK